MSSKVLSSCVLRFMNLLDTIMLEQHCILEVSYSSPPLKCFLKEQDLLGGSTTRDEAKLLSGGLSHPFPYLRNIFHGVVA